jgi:SIR2-like domain
LAGIVQAFLVTRHMLFVGFSLSDENFHRVVDAVRRIRSQVQGDARLGTVLSLGDGGLVESLWEQDLHRVRMLDKPTGDGFPFPEAARRLEIFLDYLSMKTRTMAHLLVGRRFDSLLTVGERRLRDALLGFVAALTTDGASDSVRQTVAWPQIEQLLNTLGYSAAASLRRESAS